MRRFDGDFEDIVADRVPPLNYESKLRKFYRQELLLLLAPLVGAGLYFAFTAEDDSVESPIQEFTDRLKTIDFDSCKNEGKYNVKEGEAYIFECKGQSLFVSLDFATFRTHDKYRFEKGVHNDFVFGKHNEKIEMIDPFWTCLRGVKGDYHCNLSDVRSHYKLSTEDVKILSVPFKKLRK